MGRWHDDFDDDDDRYGYYGWGYRRSTPRKATGGIKAKSTRGSIGETWWSKRWVQVLESLNMGARLTRGRSYARQGQVLSIDVTPGIVNARVQGTAPKPYNIIIKLQPLSDEDWEKVTDAMTAQAVFAARLLAGEMPTSIEEAFSAVNVSLFPTQRRDLITDCSCPDWANPCKHIAAVYYILAERFDEDPFLIFKLRGRTKEEIIEALRKKRTATLPAGDAEASTGKGDDAAEEAAIRLEDYLSTFWQAGDALETFAVNPGDPQVDKAVLKRLGEAPYAVGSQNLTELLAKAYDAVEVTALRKVTDEEAV